jgi:hypothetical protein
MARHVLLNNVEHGDLRIVTTRSAAYGDAVMSALTFPAEFRNVQAYYPIVFAKAPDTGRFQPLALFGLADGENLFLDERGWDAPYVPLAIERQPFLIGRQPTTGGDPSADSLVVHVDLDSPRVSRSVGEPVFLPHGGSTPFLQRMNATLAALHAGVTATAPFVDALVEHDLLESFVLDVELPGRGTSRLAGFYTIDEERLGALPDAALGRLARHGWLQPAFMVVASTAQFRALIERKRRRTDA